MIFFWLIGMSAATCTLLAMKNIRHIWRVFFSIKSTHSRVRYATKISNFWYKSKVLTVMHSELIFNTKSVRHIFHKKYALRTCTLPATLKYVVLLSPTFYGLKSWYFGDTVTFRWLQLSKTQRLRAGILCKAVTQSEVQIWQVVGWTLEARCFVRRPYHPKG